VLTLPLENPSYGDLPYNFRQAPGGFHLICLYFSPLYVCMYEWLVNFLTKRFKNIPSEMLLRIRVWLSISSMYFFLNYIF
jgi:hypothetical protein